MYLVTGGAGFIGSHIACRLAERGEAVRILDDFSSGSADNLAAIPGGVDLVQGDVRDAEAVRRAVAGARVVFHHAAEVSVLRSVADPLGTYAVNVTGTLNLLVAARDAGCARVVLASTSAVYGDAPQMPKHERMAPAPISPYASSKLAGEALCQVFGQAYGLDAVALRYFNVFGPRQNPASAYAAVIPRFLDTIRRGEQPVVYGDGEQSRDFVYVDDVVAANLRAAEAPGVGGRAFNIASGRAITLNAVLAAIGRELGVAVTPRHEPARAGDVRHSLADVGAARAALGFEAAVPFAEGLRRTIASLAGSPVPAAVKP